MCFSTKGLGSSGLAGMNSITNSCGCALYKYLVNSNVNGPCTSRKTSLFHSNDKSSEFN